MIKSLEIQNFQSHKHTRLEFDPGVNVIVGSSDSGKTAVIRALRWLVWNRPTGDAFRSTWGGETNVEIWIGNEKGEDEALIIRSKDKNNLYWLGDTKFTAFGADVPEEILKTLNLTEINVQPQFGRPFLLDDSPGEVARHFNRIANLDQIDQGTRAVQHQISLLNTSVKSYEEEAVRTQENLKTYEPLEEIETQVETFERLQADLIREINRKRSQENLITQIESTTQALIEASRLLPLEDQVKQLDTLIRDRNRETERHTTLVKRITDLKRTRAKIDTYADVLEAEEPIEVLLKLIRERKELEEGHRELEKILRQISLNTSARESTEADLNELQTQFKEEMPDICPLCNQPIKK